MKKILYYTASWCGPCRMLGPIMESLNGQINYEKVDVDTNTELPIKYGIRNVPTLVLIDENGTELKRLVGVKSKEEILSFYNG
jgi:thioredoxin 1